MFRERRVGLAQVFDAGKCLNVGGTSKSSFSRVLRRFRLLQTGCFVFLDFSLVFCSHPALMEGGLLFHVTLRSSLSSKLS